MHNVLSRSAAVSFGITTVACLGILFTPSTKVAAKVYSGPPAPTACTITGTTYQGTCVNEEYACGCATADGSELGPSPSCPCTY